MAETQYEAVPWTRDDLITSEALQRMSTNSDYLRDVKPDIRYRTDGVNRTRGVKILAGIEPVPKQNKGDSTTVSVRFPDFFTTNSKPVVTYGVVSNLRYVHVTITGLGGEFYPDERGFDIHVVVNHPKKKKNQLDEKLYISWTAVGY